MTGRPTKRTAEIEAKLEQAFALGSTITGACFYAGIGERTYHDWASADDEFSQRMKALKQKPVLKALQTVANDLENVNTAKWYLERKHEDFKPKTQAEVKADVETSEKVIDTSHLTAERKIAILEELGALDG